MATLRNRNSDSGEAGTKIPAPPGPSSFIPLAFVNTTAATAIDDMYNNVKTNLQGGYKRFHELPGFQSIRGPDFPIALVGGGPSIKNYEVFKSLMTFINGGTPVMCAGSPHDWLIQNNVHPDITVVCDADPITALYLKEKNKNPNAIYLLASCCDPGIYKLFDKDRIYMWHCHSDEVFKRIEQDKLEQEYQGVGGGCTVGLRCISLAIMLGYTNQQIFGYDSCVASETEHHAYEFQDAEKESLGDIHRIQLGINPEYGGSGADTSKTYLAAGYQVAQVAQFKEFYMAHYHIFKPVFHGDGMLPHFMRLIRQQEALIDKVA